LKLFLYNLENFFLVGENISPAFKKPEDKIKEISQIILQTNPDILMLLEVGGLDSLIEFNERYLNQAYIPFLVPGNSDRGIEMGYLVKKDLPYSYFHQSNKDRTIDFKYLGIDENASEQKTKFSRDISELHLIQNDKVEVIFLLVHLKSKWDRDGNDPNGTLRRKAELKALVKFYLELTLKYPKTPIIVSGDFNGNAGMDSCEEEFISIYEDTDLKSSLDLLNLAQDEKTTYFHFLRDGKRIGHQLDFIFLPQSLSNAQIKEESGVWRYQNAEGEPKALPQSIYERYALASDHYPVIAKLKFLK
jgi:endonuclease/exonuclease/phosphatase family metal-dependent hydrolase